MSTTPFFSHIHISTPITHYLNRPLASCQVEYALRVRQGSVELAMELLLGLPDDWQPPQEGHEGQAGVGVVRDHRDGNGNGGGLGDGAGDVGPSEPDVQAA